MRKHFLLLMLMALLPFAGWAEDIEVKVYGGETHFTYGEVTVPTTNAQKAAMFVYLPSTISAEVKQAVAEKLQYTSELTATSNAGTYGYTFSLISSGDRMVTGLGDGNTYVITVQDPAGSFVVEKANPVVGDVITAAPVFATEALSYTGQPQSLLKSDELGTAAAGFTLEYSVDDGAHWAADGYMVTNANTTGYTVKYRTAENTNYNASVTQAMAETKVVAKGTPSITTVPSLVAGFTYNGLEKAIIATAGVAKIGDITLTSAISYQLQKMGATDFVNEGPASTDPTTLKIKNIGEYRIQYSIPTTDPNLSPVDAVATASITVAPATLTYSIDTKEKVYGGTDPTLTVTYEGFVNEETAAVVTTPPALTRATGENAGSYDITVTNAEAVAATNYVVTAPAATAGAGKFTITPKTLNNTDFTFTLGAEPTVYTGSPITRTVATAKFGTTDMTYATDYSYVCTNNVNAGVGTANVIISGQGNFKGTVIVPFDIDPAPIYIKPADASKIYGADDPDPLTTYTLVDGVGNPVDVTLNGRPTITRVAGENVGVYTISVTGYTAGAVADNYAPTALNTYTANFTINVAGSGLVLKFKEGTTASKVYDGTTNITALAYSLNNLEVVSGLVNGEDWEDVKPTLSTPTFTLTSKDVATENNQVTVTGLASTNYPSVTVQPLPFTVEPSPIKVTVSDQTITYGSNLVAAKKDVNWVVSEGTLYGVDDLELTLKTEDALSSYAVSTTAYENAITAESANTNYDVTVVNGNLTVNAGTSVAFKTTDDMQPVITAYDTKKINVSFAADQFKMNIGEWYAMVLPFAIDPLEMVKKFDRYVIFNELNKDMTQDQNIKFTLTLNTINAGTPFLIKFASKTGDTEATKVDWSTVPFGEQTIKDGITDVTTDYVTFTATYTTKNLHYGDTGADVSDKVWWLAHNGMPKAAGGTYTDNNWKKPKTNAHDALPFEAYLTGNSGWTTYAPNITVEDFDGQTTSIKSLSVEQINNLKTDGLYNLQGVKIQGVPTQKGVYIMNGKKVVIK